MNKLKGIMSWIYITMTLVMLFGVTALTNGINTFSQSITMVSISIISVIVVIMTKRKLVKSNIPPNTADRLAEHFGYKFFFYLTAIYATIYLSMFYALKHDYFTTVLPDPVSTYEFVEVSEVKTDSVIDQEITILVSTTYRCEEFTHYRLIGFEFPTEGSVTADLEMCAPESDK